MVRISNKEKKEKMKNKKIDDLRLIDLLSKNARTSFIALAKKFKVSETAIRKRIKKLEREGVIKHYTIGFDLKKLGFKVHAFIGIDFKPENYLVCIEKIKRMREAKTIYTATGDHMLLVEVWFKDSKELKNFVKKLKSIKGVIRVCPAILIERIK